MLKQGDGVRAIADGEVVAYKLDSKYVELNYSDDRKARYSTGFVLVHHKLALPPLPDPSNTNTNDAAKPPPPDEVLDFYSLYMHQSDWASYQEAEKSAPPPADPTTPPTPAIQRMPFWQGNAYCRVGAKANDKQTPATSSPNPVAPDAPPAANAPLLVGLHIHDKPNGRLLGLLPQGTELTVATTSAPGWVTIASISKGAPVSDVQGADPKPGASNGWVFLDDLDSLIDPSPLDAVVILPKPFRVKAGNRHYMVLAARRLAMLVKQIRNIDPDETVSIIAHSQGTVISLLAQALLMQADSSDGSSAAANRPADTLVLIDSPYSVIAPWMDRATQTGDEQQTAYARARTLIELVKLVGDGKHPTPELDQLLPNTADCRGRAGPAWTPTQAKRFNPKTDDANKAVVFAERDNRGKVYLYFCPEDATVALKTVQGIGTNGVPDTAAVYDPDAGKTVDMPLMTPLIASGFHQRVFTRRKRNGATVKVGTAPQVYTLREKGETSHGTTGFINTQIKQGGNSVGATRQVNGEELNPPFDPDLQGNVIPGTENKPIDANETAPGKQSWDQMETEVALTRLKLQTLTDQPLPWPGAGVDPSKPSVAEVQAQYDANPDPDDRCQVFDVTAGSPVAPDVRYVTRTETPNEAKVRLMNDPKRLGDSSYHSAIMSGQKNHRYGTAMDVAIGQGKALDDLEWGTLLRFIADWRTPLGMISVKCRAKYPQLIPGMRALVEATCEYYTSGAFPTDLVPEKPPKPVVSETLTMQNQVSREATRTPANASGGTI